MKKQITLFASFLIIFTLFFSLKTRAQTTFEIDKDTIALQSLKAIDVKTSPLCPPNVTCITDGTVVALKFLLPTCVDKLGPVTYKAVQNKKYIELYVSAFAQINKSSALVKCFAPTYETAQITLIGQFGSVRVKYADAPAYLEK